MPITNFGSGLQVGSGIGAGADAGFAVLSKRVTMQANGTASQAFTCELPPSGVRILSMHNETTAAHTAATMTLAVGNAAGGNQLVSATDIKALGRDALQTDANMAAIAGFTGGTLHLTLAAGTPTTTGTSAFVVQYTYEG